MDKKLTILHTEWSKGWGGQEIRILGESISLLEHGYSVIICAQPDSQLLAKSIEAQIPCYAVKMHKGLSLYALFKIFTLVKKEQINIIHTHSSVDARIAGLAGRLRKVAVVRSRHLSTPIKARWTSRFLYMRLADHIITSGESIRTRMIRVNKMPPEHISSIPAGVDENKFFPIEPDHKLMLKLGLSKNNFIVGIVAVLRTWKGHKSLFEAISLYRKKNPEIRLLVLGDGPIKNELLDLIKKLGLEANVLMIGHIIDTPRYYSLMDAVILNSYSNEATSQTLPQAMMMKIPVIGTNIGSIPEVVIHKITGLLINPESPEEIISAINELYVNKQLRDELATQGQLHALERFTKSQMINNTLNVYKRVLHKNLWSKN